MEEVDKILKSPDVVIPEAVLWKRTVLALLWNAIKLKAEFYASTYVDDAKFVQKEYQGTVIALYSYLKPKLIQKELKEFKIIEKFSNSKYNPQLLLKIDYLNKCLDILNRAIERIGITKAEIPQKDIVHLFKRS